MEVHAVCVCLYVCVCVCVCVCRYSGCGRVQILHGGIVANVTLTSRMFVRMWWRNRTSTTQAASTALDLVGVAVGRALLAARGNNHIEAAVVLLAALGAAWS